MNRTSMLSVLQNAELAAILSEAIYRGRDAIEVIAKFIGAQYRYIEVSYVRAAVLTKDDRTFITVAGTNDVHDWVQNLDARLTSFQGLSVHTGFAESTEMLLNSFSKHGVFEFTKTQHVTLCGHSAGGSIAQLVALDERINTQSIFTFGSPRVFSPESALLIAGFGWHIFRIVLPYDPVPLYPLRDFKLLYGSANYRHTGTTIEVDTIGNLSLESDRGIVSKAIKTIRRLSLYFTTLLATTFRTLPSVFTAHSMEKYLVAVKTAIRRKFDE